MRRLVPVSYYKLPVIRSYAVVGDDGDLYRVEVRKDPSSGRLVQATFLITVPAADRKEPVSPSKPHNPLFLAY